MSDYILSSKGPSFRECEYMSHSDIWERIRQHVPNSWFMLDLRVMPTFIWEYGNYRSKGVKSNLSPMDWFYVWAEQIKLEQECSECRIR